MGLPLLVPSLPAAGRCGSCIHQSITSTPAMETLTKINSDALLNAGATTVPIWPLWHSLAPSDTLWRHLVPPCTSWFSDFQGRVALFSATRFLLTVGHCLRTWPSSSQHQHLYFLRLAFPCRSLFLFPGV